MAERRGEPGEIVERALVTLRALPADDREAVTRIVASAARGRAVDAAPNDDDLLPLPLAPRRRRAWGAIGALAAAAVIGALFVGTGVWRSMPQGADGGDPVITPRATVAAVTPAAAPREAAEAALVPTQFVFDGKARHVALVGDFNNWDEWATPLQREPGSSLWSVTVPIQRGRHIYAFLVDSRWTVDKRAPVARDPDFGVTGSVIIAGRP